MEKIIITRSTLYIFIIIMIFFSFNICAPCALFAEEDKSVIGHEKSELYLNEQVTAMYEDQIWIEAENAILLDFKTGNVLWGKNYNEQVYPASMTKIMTGILAIENIDDFNEIIEISESAAGVNHSAFNFNKGDRISLIDLLKSAMICSHNNATIALAEYISGSVDGFITIMNNKAIELGAYNTNFKNTNGLDSDFPEHKTTAHDIALISKYAMENELFRNIVSTEHDVILLNDEEIPLKSTNKLLELNYIKGIKTGYTENAGFCLAAYSDLNGLELITVILNSTFDKREYDALKLINWADDNIKEVKIVDSGKIVASTNIGSSTIVNIELYPENDVVEMLHVKNNNIDVKKTIYDKTELPVDTTDDMGVLEVLLNGGLIGSTNIISMESIGEPYVYQDISYRQRNKKIIILSIILSFYFLIIIFIIFKNLSAKKYNR
jgi:serine-type D-Ala-D-Ala carboxypeptidase (penicillin-binding protein 5/6)